MKRVRNESSSQQIECEWRCDKRCINFQAASINWWHRRCAVPLAARHGRAKMSKYKHDNWMYHVLLINNHRQDVGAQSAEVAEICCKANAPHMPASVITYQQVRLSTKPVRNVASQRIFEWTKCCSPSVIILPTDTHFPSANRLNGFSLFALSFAVEFLQCLVWPLSNAVGLSNALAIDNRLNQSTEIYQVKCHATRWLCGTLHKSHTVWLSLLWKHVEQYIDCEQCALTTEWEAVMANTRTNNGHLVNWTTFRRFDHLNRIIWCNSFDWMLNEHYSLTICQLIKAEVWFECLKFICWCLWGLEHRLL